MKKTIIALSILLLMLVSCTANPKKNEKLTVVASYTIIADMLHQVGGDKIEINNLVPTGTDPHEYEPLPNDIKDATDADLMFYNGLNLEGGQSGWFYKLVNSVKKTPDKVIDLSLGIDPMYIVDGSQSEDMINPHAYLNPKNGMIMVENILQSLIKEDPDNETFYTQNAEVYLEKLKTIDNNYRINFDNLNKKDKVLITSERAFQYMNEEYGIKEGYIWAIDTEETGTASQIKALSQFIKDEDVKVLFVESNVDRRPMETVSKETGVPIYKDVLYSDEIGKKGSEVDTYEKLLNHNLEVMMGGLK